MKKMVHKNTIRGKDVAQLDVAHLHHHAQGPEFNAQDTMKPGMQAETYNSSTLKVKRKIRDLKVILSYTGRPCLKKDTIQH